MDSAADSSGSPLGAAWSSSTIRCSACQAAYSVDEVDIAENYYDRALLLLDDSKQAEHPLLRPTLDGLARIYVTQGNEKMLQHVEKRRGALAK